MNRLALQTIISERFSGKRLDQALAGLYPEYSRVRIQKWINAGQVRVNNKCLRQRDKVAQGDTVRIDALLENHHRDKPEAIPLDILYEDAALIIINKPTGLVVHPGNGNPEHTLVNALLHFDRRLDMLPRAGIIHRLDKDTTGVMVIARTPEAQTHLVRTLRTRGIRREYQTIVAGQVAAGGVIENNIGRHPRQRTKMAVNNSGKIARTHYRVIKKYRNYTHLYIQLDTGRTHQIRVHMAHIKHPIVGDAVYGKNKSVGNKGINEELHSATLKFKRQALHAYYLELPHPVTGEKTTFCADLPEDMRDLIKRLEKYDVLPNR